MYLLGITWNPDDTLFTLGFLQIKYYNLLWILAFVVGWFLMKRIFTNENKTTEQLDSLFIYTVIATMLGARLGHVFFYDWDHYKTRLAEILLPIKKVDEGSLFGLINGYEFTGFTGLASHGATIGIIIGIYLYTRKHKGFKMMWIFDRLTIPVAIGAAMVRLGNFFNSEINGEITESTCFLATRFIRDSDDMPAYRAMQLTGEQDANSAYKAIANDPQFASILEGIPYRYPAQLYEAIFYILIFGILYWLYWKKGKGERTGFLFGLFMVLLWSVRFVVEFVKKSQGGFEDPNGVISTGQWLSIPFILLGLFFMFWKSGKKVS